MRSKAIWSATVTTAALLTAVPAHSQPASTARPAEASPALPPATELAPWPSPAADGRGSTLPWPRIEQVRRGNRIVEVTVTDADGDHRYYTMVNREGRLPLSTQELSSGLSTPSFFKVDF
jgi:hypothetical protein